MGKLFSTINDSFLYPKNLEHSQKVMEKLSPQAQPDKTLLDYLYPKSLDEISEIFSDLDPNLNISLICMLIYDAQLSGRFDQAKKLNLLFDGDFLNKIISNPDNPDSINPRFIFRGNNGCSTSYNKIGINDEGIKKDLAIILYNGIGHLDKVPSGEFDLMHGTATHIKKMASIRMSKDINNYDQNSLYESDVHDSVKYLSSLDPDFFSEDSLRENLYLIEKDLFHDGAIKPAESTIRAYFLSIACALVCESVRSRAISGIIDEKFIEGAKRVGQVIIDHVGLIDDENEDVSEFLIKAALIITPVEYKKFYGNNLPSIDEISRMGNLLGTGGRDIAHKISRIFCIDFSFSSVKIGTLENSALSLLQYGDESLDLLMAISSGSGVSVNSIPAVLDACHSHDPIVADKVLQGWLRSLIKNEKNNAEVDLYPLLAEASIIILGENNYNLELSKSTYNEALLDTLIKFPNEGSGLKFAIKTPSEKAKFIEESRLHEKTINNDIILAGNFSQSDFKKYWKSMSGEIKRQLISCEMSI